MKRKNFIPGLPWPDNNGVHINAHGGGILYHKGTYYWYGEHKTAGDAGNRAQVGVHVYASTDLYNWSDRGIALTVSDDPASDIVRNCIIERPKVLYNSYTKKFVMWFHLERAGEHYSAARCGVAVADTPCGPFTFLHSMRPHKGQWPVDVTPEQQDPATFAPALAVAETTEGGYHEGLTTVNSLGAYYENGQESRDMTLFRDGDGTAYHLYSSERNSTLHIGALTADYTFHAGRFKRTFVHRWMEAPAVCRTCEGRYLFLASDCTGWAPNAARSAVAESIFGPWTETGNPCVGVNPHNGLGPEKTFGGQSTFLLPVHGRKDAFIAMFDIWTPENPIDGHYVWLPVTLTDAGYEIRWLDEWNLGIFGR